MPRTARVLTGLVVAGLAITALRLPSPTPGLPGALLQSSEPDLQEWAQHDTLNFGETLAALLARRGLSPGEAARVISAATPIDHRRIPAGMEVVVAGDTSEAARPKEIRFHLAVDRIVRMNRAGEEWSAKEEVLPWTIDTVLVRGVVESSLYDAVEKGSAEVLPGRASAELAWNIADIYEYRIDMSREMRQGDEIRVLFERRTAPNGTVRVGDVFAAGLQRNGSDLQAIRMPPEHDNGRSKYYDQSGRSLAGTFLRAPVTFRRISSNFGRRKHPILGTWRSHQGMDYAAASGTPVRSVGDGTVIFVGAKGGYGNTVEVRHPNGFVTRYGHLRGYAKGLRRGMRVDIEQTIGYVGMTGLATGPHLHFEVLVNGVQRDPRRALEASSGPPLTGDDLNLFQRIRDGAIFALEQPPGVVKSVELTPPAVPAPVN